MSTPPNILSKFRSHSYYHVLAVCDRSSTAEALINSTDLSVWSRSKVVENDRLGKWTPMGFPSPEDPMGGQYSILIHGATDADLGIDSYRITSYTAANATAGDRNTSIATEGEIIITEPKGVILFDLLVSLMNEMKSDSSSMCFVMKTFFVGHGYDDADGEFSHTISDVTPVMFLLTDAAATFTESGGVYTLQIVAMANGVSRLPQYAKAADGASIQLDKMVGSRATVKQAMDELFKVINTNYEHHYNCVIAIAKQKKIENPEKRFFRVRYEVDVDPMYAGEEYSLTDCPMQYKTHGGDCKAPPSFKNKPGASIEDAMHRLMGFCPRVKQDMVDGVGSGPNAVKYEYKIHSAASTIMDGDTKVTVVRYSVRKFLSPRGFNIKELLESKNTEIDSTALRENLITFDYIFSGKNIDILEFNIQMNYGLAYMQSAATSNSFKGQLEGLSSRTRHVSMHSDKSTSTGEPLPTPVFFSPQLRGLAVTNTNTPAETFQSSVAMAKHASIEVAEATMKIYGNPRLYSSIVATTNPANLDKPLPAFTKPNDAAGDLPNTPTLAEADFKRWSQLPALAKVNIYMPSHNDDVALMSGSGYGPDEVPPDYRKQFWYDGYYYVYGVENNFDYGDFTQQLLMVAIPNGSLLEAGNLKSETEQTIKSVTDCYTNKVPPTTPATTRASTASAPFSPDKDGKSAVPTNKADADSVNVNAGELSNVKNWDGATSEVKTAITQVSKRYGMDPVVVAQFARQESTFQASVRNPRSPAVGLFQFIPKTWLSLVRNGQIAGIPRNMNEQDALALRTDPEYSTIAAIELMGEARRDGVTTTGDFYLYHFMGGPRARKIIEACNSGQGSNSLAQTIGSDAAQTVLASNPYLKDKDTAGVRAWAATVMARTLKNGTPVAGATDVGSTQGAKAPPDPQAPVSIGSAEVPNTNMVVAWWHGLGKKDAPVKSSCGPTEPTKEAVAQSDNTNTSTDIVNGP